MVQVLATVGGQHDADVVTTLGSDHTRHAGAIAVAGVMATFMKPRSHATRSRRPLLAVLRLGEVPRLHEGIKYTRATVAADAEEQPGLR